jgi:hypothetical protein
MKKTNVVNPIIMKLSEFKTHLESLNNIQFQLPDSSLVPEHFHITEIGRMQRHFVDCGGKERMENRINFQLWVANDFDHRLSPEKLKSIIAVGEKTLGLPDAEIEIEYQGSTIQKFELSEKGGIFQLVPTQTACLAEDACGIPTNKAKVNLSEINQSNSSCCGPNSNCC